jgi:hypothetical protein
MSFDHNDDAMDEAPTDLANPGWWLHYSMSCSGQAQHHIEHHQDIALASLFVRLGELGVSIARELRAQQ